MSVLVHADTKVGKSSFAATCPKPMVLFDAEAAYRFLDTFLDGRMIFWDPMTSAPPEPDGTWDIATVRVLHYGSLAKGVEWLEYGQHKFRSAAFDSVSEAQKKFKAEIQGTDFGMDQQKWGAVLEGTETLCRKLRDLTEHPTTPLEAIVVTAMTEMRDGKWRPYLQGASRNTTPYFFDIIGYMDVFTQLSTDPQVPATQHRRMQVNKSNLFEAGERVGNRLGDPVWYPNMATMLDTVFGPLQVAEAAITGEVQA